MSLTNREWPFCPPKVQSPAVSSGAHLDCGAGMDKLHDAVAHKLRGVLFHNIAILTPYVMLFPILSVSPGFTVVCTLIMYAGTCMGALFSPGISSGAKLEDMRGQNKPPTSTCSQQLSVAPASTTV